MQVHKDVEKVLLHYRYIREEQSFMDTSVVLPYELLCEVLLLHPQVKILFFAKVLYFFCASALFRKFYINL